MNHTPTGWSAPVSEATPIAVDADTSGDRSRSDTPAKAGRVVACAAAKAPMAQRADPPPPPQNFIIHSDAEHQADDTPISVAETDEEDIIAIAAIDVAIHQKELEILRAKRDVIAKKASMSKKSAVSVISSMGGDVDNLLTLLEETDPKLLTEVSLRNHEESQSSAAIHEA